MAWMRRTVLIPIRSLHAFPELRGRTILLFLGRVHFKKGLDLLLAAWARLEQQFPHATLVLAGPDAENSMAGVQDMVRQQGITRRVLCTGMLGADLKWSALAAAHCFVLPSYSEGLSVAVLEALSMGVPVIASDKCHVPEVEACGAGWVVKTEVAAVRRRSARRACAVGSRKSRHGSNAGACWHASSGGRLWPKKWPSSTAGLRAGPSRRASTWKGSAHDDTRRPEPV